MYSSQSMKPKIIGPVTAVLFTLSDRRTELVEDPEDAREHDGHADEERP